MNPYNILRSFVIISLLLIATNLSYAQMTELERQKLQTLVDQLHQNYLAKQAELEALSKGMNIPLTITYGGRQLILTDIVNGDPIYDGSFNVQSMESVSANQVKTGGALGLNLTGAGLTLGIWEAFDGSGNAGVRTSHQEFGSRATAIDLSGFSNHATHVAGTMIASGMDADAEGFSSGANLQCFDISGDLFEMGAAALAIPPVSISNHSYGSVSGWDWDNDVSMWRWVGNAAATEDWEFGAYTSVTQNWDNTAYSAPFLLIVKAAGNDGDDFGPAMGGDHFHGNGSTVFNDSHAPDGPFDCIPTYGNAKNILTVGAVQDVTGGYFSPFDVVLDGFSSTGPADDGRIKPDLVANGDELRSSGGFSDTHYYNSWGTSMSTPSVSGSAGLLLQHWANEISGVPRAATLKDLMIHTADECGPADGPDYRFGWGLLDVSDAAQLITTEAIDGCQQFIEGTINPNTIFSFDIHSSGLTPIRVSLVWADPHSLTVNTGTVNPLGASYLVNDLDLRITQGASTFLPWVLDPANPANPAVPGVNNRDNVEQVVIPTPGAGIYTIEVVAPAMTAPQDFSLVFSGNDAVVENLTIAFVTLNDERKYAARNQITFGPTVEIILPADVEAVAGNQVNLIPGFWAKAGANFLARIEPGGGCASVSGMLMPGPTAMESQSNGIGSDLIKEKAQSATPGEGAIELKIMPNPADQYVLIKFTLPKTTRAALKITNELGQTVLRPEIGALATSGEQILEFSSGLLSPGVYFVILETEQGRYVEKLLVQHR